MICKCTDYFEQIYYFGRYYLFSQFDEVISGKLPETFIQFVFYQHMTCFSLAVRVPPFSDNDMLCIVEPLNKNMFFRSVLIISILTPERSLLKGVNQVLYAFWTLNICYPIDYSVATIDQNFLVRI